MALLSIVDDFRSVLWCLLSVWIIVKRLTVTHSRQHILSMRLSSPTELFIDCRHWDNCSTSCIHGDSTIWRYTSLYCMNSGGLSELSSNVEQLFCAILVLMISLMHIHVATISVSYIGAVMNFWWLVSEELLSKQFPKFACFILTRFRPK
jgi:hypothetical protein